MFKIISVILSLLLAVSLSACGGTVEAPSPGNESGSQDAADTGSNASAPESTVSLSGEIGGEITVSAYDTMKSKAFLEDAARLFEEKHPGTKVNVETFSAMPEIKTSEQGNQKMTAVQIQDDPQGRQDYINKVNTSLMSGQGADVLAMDVLPVHKYADSGQLENLAAYMESDPEFNRADYRENILDAVEYKNAAWFMPLDYTFDYYAYDSTLLTGEAASRFGTSSAFTVEELIGLAKASFDGSNLLFNTPDYVQKGSGGMWGSLLEENYTSFVDIENKTAGFGDGRFEALLESVKQYSEQGYISKGVTGQRNAGAMMQAGQGQGPTERIFFKPKNAFNLISQFTRDIGMRMNIVMSGGVMAIEDDDEIAGIKANAGGAVPFTCEQAYGINANSQNKETAWAFVKFLLSEEMQLNTSMTMPTALPLLNSAREKKAEAVLGGFAGQKGEPLDEKLSDALAKYNETIERLSDQINTYVFEDTIVNDMIAAEVQYFFDGTKTAAEVADVLQNKVDLYLNE